MPNLPNLLGIAQRQGERLSDFFSYILSSQQINFSFTYKDHYYVRIYYDRYNEFCLLILWAKEINFIKTPGLSMLSDLVR